jgi:XXXCH domain-containing protein
MKGEFDDVMDKKTFGEMLIRMGQELSQHGRITLDEGEVELPDGFSVKVKCKSKIDKKRGGENWKFGIKCKWAEGTMSVPRMRAGVKKGTRSRSVKENKKSLGTFWTAIMTELNRGRLPSPEIIKSFEELNREFDTFTKSKWKKEMVVYMKTVEEFVQALSDSDIQQAKKVARQLAKLKSDCHNLYK